MGTITIKRILVWTPRTLGLGFVLFLMLFSFDAFEASPNLEEKFQMLLLHLLPALALFFASVFAWRWQWVGALFFGGFSIWYLTIAWGIFPLSVYLIMVGPASLIAMLYLINYRISAGHSITR